MPSKGASVRVVIVVAFGALIRQAQKGLAQSPRLPFEPPNIRVCDCSRRVATTARQVLVPTDQAEPGLAVVEGARAKPDRVELASEMVLMAGCAGATQPGVQARSLVDSGPQGRVAAQALGGRNSSLSEFMAVRTVTDALKRCMGRGEFPWRNDLGLRVAYTRARKKKHANGQPGDGMCSSKLHCPAMTGS